MTAPPNPVIATAILVVGTSCMRTFIDFSERSM
jgi:hypothetical protein